MTLKECLIEALTNGRKCRRSKWEVGAHVYWVPEGYFCWAPHGQPFIASELSSVARKANDWELVPEPKKYEIWVPVYLRTTENETVFTTGLDYETKEAATDAGHRGNDVCFRFVGVRKIEYTEGEEV